MRTKFENVLKSSSALVNKAFLFVRSATSYDTSLNSFIQKLQYSVLKDVFHSHTASSYLALKHNFEFNEEIYGSFKRFVKKKWLCY